MIEIDGSFGEGGGQIIRTALSLSALLGIPFRVRNVRQNRPKPGLRAQHLAAVRAVKSISQARTQGDYVGSREIVFEPGKITGDHYRFDIGTAGATPLVLQALLPPLVYAEKESTITLIGGTHVPISPPFHFLRDVFLPVVREMGIKVEVSIHAYGFYPRGGGEIQATVRPLEKGFLSPFACPSAKSVWSIDGVSAVGNLPLSIAERQKQAALLALRGLTIGVHIETTSVHSPGAGTYVFLKSEGGACRAGFSSIGVRGKRAEQVGTEAAVAFLDYYHRAGCIDPHLADQLAIYQALAKGESSFTTTEVTQHLLTNLSLIQQFLGMEYHVEGPVGSPGTVQIAGIGFEPARSLTARGSLR